MVPSVHTYALHSIADLLADSDLMDDDARTPNGPDQDLKTSDMSD